jgi:hypothetical protein
MLSPISEPEPLASARTTGGWLEMLMNMVMTMALIDNQASGW